MNVNKIANIDDIMINKLEWPDFFRPYEQSLRDYLNSFGNAKTASEKTAQDQLIKEVELLLIDWYEDEKANMEPLSVSLAPNLQKYLDKEKADPYPIKGKPVSKILQLLLVPALLNCIDTIPDLKTEFNSVLDSIIRSVFLEVIKEKEQTRLVENHWSIDYVQTAIIEQAVRLVLHKLKEKNKKLYHKVLASDETYLRDRVTEQLLIQRIRQNDNQAIEELTSFSWLGITKKKALENSFKSKIVEGIKADSNFQEIKSYITYLNEKNEEDIAPSYIYYAIIYIWCKLVHGDEKTLINKTPFHNQNFILKASLITYLKGIIFQSRYRGKIQNYIRKEETKKNYGYSIKLDQEASNDTKEITEEIESDIKNDDPFLMDPFDDNNLQEGGVSLISIKNEPDYITYRDAVREVFWSSKLKSCRGKLLNFDKGLSIIEGFLSDDDLFKEELNENVPEKIKSSASLRSQCYKTFISELFKYLI